jgi:hypothetical protein
LGRPPILDEKLLRKIAIKRGRPDDINSVRKLVDSRARRANVSSSVGLILLARDHNIGFNTYRKKLSPGEEAQLGKELTGELSGIKPTGLQIHRKKPTKPEKKLESFINYETKDYFKKGHIAELNRAFQNRCFTSVYILARKIIENLIIDILRKKFPEKNESNKELYFDTPRRRFKDFAVILKNLKLKSPDFGTSSKAVDRLYVLALNLKDDANDKTHSWFHLVENRREIEGLQIKTIIELIIKLEVHVGIRDQKPESNPHDKRS